MKCEDYSYYKTKRKYNKMDFALTLQQIQAIPTADLAYFLSEEGIHPTDSFRKKSPCQMFGNALDVTVSLEDKCGTHSMLIILLNLISDRHGGQKYIFLLCFKYIYIIIIKYSYFCF